VKEEIIAWDVKAIERYQNATEEKERKEEEVQEGKRIKES